MERKKCVFKRLCCILQAMDLFTMDWQLPDIGETITNNILPSILSTHTVSMWRFNLVSIGDFHHCIYRLKSVISVNFRIWSKYVGYIPFPWIRNDLYIVVVLVV